jgi:5-methylcytosine-specific restriction endonuclease McrA
MNEPDEVKSKVVWQIRSNFAEALSIINWFGTRKTESNGKHYVGNDLREIDKEKQRERLERLKSAPRKPEKYIKTSYEFRRNQDVIDEVLYRASGICRGCKKPAPFRSIATREPYLEVHHIIQLANDGEDTIENAIALCPNCHRKAHFG